MVTETTSEYAGVTYCYVVTTFDSGDSGGEPRAALSELITISF